MHLLQKMVGTPKNKTELLQPQVRKRIMADRKTQSKNRVLQEAIRKFTPQQLAYRKNRLNGLSIFASAVQAGYSRSYARTAASTKLERLVKPSIIEELEAAGATNEWQAQQALRIATEAEKYSKGGFIPDEGVRLAALDHIARLKKQTNQSNSSIIPDGQYTKLTIVVEKDNA